MNGEDERAAWPIAVIGLACRLPGAPSPRALWRLLSEGRSAVGEPPAERHATAAAVRDEPGIRYGGYLEAIDTFDPEFFGISPREAAAMDPQQRLVLELAWEVLEDAGVVPASLHGTATGVFVGSIADEYAALSRPAGIGRHTLTGTTRGMIANRVSYTLGLRGPSIAVDTAQSSSLVAVHLACESLRRGESGLAVAGGVNLIVDPHGTTAVARFGGLSPDGRCHTFDSRANGYVRGEGAGLVLLKPLDAAVEDGDPVYAVLLGGAVNNDGTTDGLTVPSAEAQAAVLRRAWRAAGVTPADVQYVELHGTGTPVGDPVEARALGLARDTGPVLEVGSVKTNVGHLEGAAGITGLLKTVLSVAERALPASLNYAEPNPAIDLDGWRLSVRDRGGAWPRGDRRLVAGVSSFGMGGTNCHLVVAEPPGPPEPGDPPPAPGPATPLVLSARTEPALRDQAAALRDLLAEHGDVPDGLARALATDRAAFAERAAVTGDVRTGLEALADGRPAAGVARGRAAAAPLAVLFPGQGSQRPGMGLRAYQEFAAWRAAFDEVAEALDARLPRPVREVVWAGEQAGRPALLDRTAFTQPALFAIEVACFRLLSALGVKPSFVAGHSIGEVAAAHVAGILDLPAAAELIVARGRLMGDLAEGGHMLAVAAGEHEVAELVAGAGGVAAIAAVNGPAAVVVSGESRALDGIAARAAERGLRSRRLVVSHAFHSPLMDPMLAEFRSVLEGLSFGRARIPFVSTVTGQAVETTDPDYWVAHARQPVRFADGLRRLSDLGAGTFVEAGPGAALSGLGREMLGRSASFVPLLGKDDDVARAVGGLFTAGTELDWDTVFPPGGPRVALPTYPFQRERYWLDTTPVESGQVGAQPVTSAPAPSASGRAGTTSAALAPAASDIDVERLVLDEVAAVLGFADPARVDRDATFKDLGLDSLGMVELRDRLGAAVGVDLPTATLFSHPSTAALTGHLRGATTETEVVVRRDDGDPVVIVGMGCRYPGGVASPDDLWDLVASGADAIGEFPGDRGWDLDALFDPDPERPGTSYTRYGGFLHDAAEFDAEFFGISPREALAIDPQQRLLLQTSWEALERAGIDPLSLRGSDTGVFIGATASDYTPRLHEGGGGADGYLLTGGSISVASGRIAYVLGLGGPALTVDTACSSSLVALDLAVRAVRSGECSLALAGGVAVMASPGMFVEFSRQRGLSVDGRCRAFGAGADGTGWAEGVGVVVVERLSRARGLGHRVLAVVAGSAVNQDGASNGLTAPSGRAQERVMVRALGDAGLVAGDVDVVEGHGTGTRLGDPIEAQALINVYGGGRGEPLWLGSLKSNLGHAQAAAGVGGVIKMVMALRHGVLPRTLHAETPSPHVRWEGSGVRLLDRRRVWPDRGRPRRAAVSSFGISGTNTHVILQQPPAEPDRPSDQGGPAPLVLSAKTETALRSQAAALHKVLASDAAPDTRDIACTLARRTPFEYRAVIDADAELPAALAALRDGEGHPGVLTGRAASDQRLAFLFSGQGAQRIGMGTELLAAGGAYTDAFAEVGIHLEPLLGIGLRELLAEAPERLRETRYAQPALFAVEVALHRLATAHGLRPDFLIGHSIGELAAAHIAGIFDLEDACTLVAARGRLMQSARTGGAMAAFAATESQAAELVAPTDGAVEIAAINGPAAAVLSGDAETIDALVADWKKAGHRATRLKVSHAFHSPHMDEVLDEFRAVVSGLTFAAPEIPIISTATGALSGELEMSTPEYWVAQLRGPVRFAGAVRAAHDAGVTRFAELGPDGSLAAMAQETADGVLAVPLLRPGKDERGTVRHALSRLHVAGVPVDFEPLFPSARLVDLPTYPFETRRYWLRQPDDGGRPDSYGLDGSPHPLLAAAAELPDAGGRLYTGVLSVRRHPWLGDHRIDGRVLVPAAALVDLALAVGVAAGRPTLTDFVVHVPVELDETAEVRLQATVSGDGELTVRSNAAGEQWTVHVTAVLATSEIAPATTTPPARAAARVDAGGVEETYRLLADHGYEYGPAFQALAIAWREGETLFAEAELPADLQPEVTRYGLHPALLDAVLHVLSLDGIDGPRRVPYSLDGVRLHAAGATRVRARLTPAGADAYRADVIGDDGHPVLTIERLRLRPLPSAAGLYRLRWETVPAPVPGSKAAGATLLDLRADADDPLAGAEAARRAVQEWLAGTEGEDGAGDRLVIVTHGLAVDEHEPMRSSAAAVWGLVRAAQAEHPGRFSLLDADGGAQAELLAAIGARLPEAMVRGDTLRVPRLVNEAEPVAEEPSWPRSAAGGTVLITGGTGALGREIARHLVTRHGVRNLLLAGRRGDRHPEAARTVAELTALGARVTVRACDPVVRTALADLLAELDGPLTGVVHAAGVTDDAVVERLSAEALRRVVATKAVAARNLDELTRDHGLDAFVLFGSVAAVVGTAGQGNYCAANAALEAIAHGRRLSGRPALTVHWGLWDIGAGLAAELTDRDIARLGQAGIRPMSGTDGLALFDRAIRSDATALVAARLDLRAAERRRRPRPTARPVPAPVPVSPADTSGLVLESIAAVLGHASATEIDPERAFSEIGFDSLTAVELRNLLSDRLGVRLPGTVVFDHPNPAALIRFVEDRAGGRTRAAEITDPGADQDAEQEPAGAADDPIAIVGMACRFPGGVRTPAALWELLAEGSDAISEFPADRGWDLDLFDPDPERSGTSSTRHGGFLHDAAEFDPEFFGISPREALAIDPQQRLLLQTAWEAAEDAYIDPATLRGSQTGVFVGVMYSDYGARLHQRRGAAGELEGYLVSGSAGSVASGRISYSLGLEGPAVTVDTACSSSLVAVHQAAQSLRLGECSLALAGGATVMASPATFIEFSRQRGLAPDGRCKPFSAAADGTAWAEGAGLLVLERLSDARRNGHRVLAVVRGSAVNQDGASNGLTAPNGPAQERVIRGALRGAGLRAADVDVLEAHGTGTTLGDPIEAGAVLNTYGADRDDRAPLLMGSVKSNLGHTQAAAGAAGIIKMVLAMRHGQVPGTLHAERLSGHVDWSAGSVAVPTGLSPWPDTPGPRRAAVSSFGISGTNAHVILEQVGPAPDPDPVPELDPAPESDPAPEADAGSAGDRVVPWVLSARTPAALREQAIRLKEHVLADPRLRVGDVALSLATTRTAFDRRGVVLGRDRAELLDGLDHLIEGTSTPAGSFPAVFTGSPVRGKTAVLFTGQGSQRVGMGIRLYEAFPVYARAFDEVCAQFRAVAGPDVAAIASGAAPEGAIDRTRGTQAALFAVEVALFRLLESWGLAAELLAGHSIGEIAAAHLSGALSLGDAAALVATRGRLMQELPEGGLMAAVQADAETVARLVAETGKGVDIAAVNAPGSVVLSGDADAVEELLAVLAGRGHRVRRLTVSHAFHSAHMDPMLDAFRAELGELAAADPSRTVVSTLTGREAGAESLGSAAHWVEQVRGGVRFADAVGRLRELGAVRFLEVGPDAALTAMVRQCDLGDDGVAMAALDRRRDDLAALWAFVARAFLAGVGWDWRELIGGGSRIVPLPTYPFHRERLWLPPPAGDATAAGIGADEPDHPLLAASIDVPGEASTVYTGVLSHRRSPWLADHALRGVPVLPATALVDLLGWLAARHGGETVAELTLHAPVPVPEDEDVRLRVTVAGTAVRVHVRPAGAGEWALHAEATLGTDPGPAPTWHGSRPSSAEAVDVADLYARLADRGYDYGPAFQGVRELWRSEDELFAEVDTGGDLVPGLLDATLHSWLTGVLDAPQQAGIDVPYGWQGIRLHGTPTGPLRVKIRLTGERAFALEAIDAGGLPVFSVDEVRLRAVEAAALSELTARRAVKVEPYELGWVAAAHADGPWAGHAVSLVLGAGTRTPGTDDLALPFPVVRALDGSEDLVVATVASGPDHEPAAAVRAGIEVVRDLILTLPERAHLVVVTRGAVAVDDTDRLPGLAEAALWGLVRTAQHEQPERVSIVDVDGHAESAALLPGLAATRPGQAAVRAGKVFRPRLRVVTGAPAGPPDLGTGTVLVTGAGGALGAATAQRLVAVHGARRLLLVSRRGAADPALPALAELLAGDAEVEVAACDLADAAAVETLISGIGSRHPLTAVFHAAGALDDAVLENLTSDRLDRVLRPKVDAAWNLHRLTSGLPLTAFVLYSSVAGVLGNAGQAGYAAGNAFLDALAQRRRAEGLPGTSLAWGLWETGPDAGMAAELDGASRARLDRLGVRALPVAAGLELLDRSLASGRALLVPAWFDQAALARRSGTPPAVLADLVPARPAPVAAAVPLPQRVAGMPEAGARTLVHEVVTGRVAEVLGLASAAAVPDDRGLFDAGLDSLTAIELRNRLSSDLGERLPATVLFDHPTVRALTEHLLDRCELGGPGFDTAVLAGWVSDAGRDEERRAGLVRALKEALDALGRDGAADGGPTFGMDSASDDELFGLLDRELSE
ncbi:type I polyketide synthase [Actinomadura fulvescens]|uniref:Type I polyketide synthase n=1 Tax=Actinomadura fulvescens TaxID=46160 RepID=A0ABN3PH98_9ACTN